MNWVVLGVTEKLENNQGKIYVFDLDLQLILFIIVLAKGNENEV